MKKLFSLILVALISSQMWAVNFIVRVSPENVATVSGTYTPDKGSAVSISTSTSVTKTYTTYVAFNLSYTITNSSYKFKQWTYGTLSPTISGNSISMGDTYAKYSAPTITAVFELDVSDVTVAVALADGCTGMGTVSGGTTVASGTSVTITASANANYYFKGWSTTQNGNTIVSNNASYTVSASDATYYAVFAAYKTSTVSPTDNNSNTNWTSAVVPDGYVDLGLPSGTLWSTKNLGADSEYALGNLYAWGSKTARSNSSYNQFTYANYDATALTATYTGNSTYDVATSTNASDHTPTQAEWQELLDNCTWVWSSNKFTVSNAGQSITLLACGIGRGEQWNSSSCCYYWSSTYESGSGATKMPYYLLGYNGYEARVTDAAGTGHSGDGYAHHGMPIRPVRAGVAAKVLTIQVKVGSSVVATHTYRCNDGEKVKITADDDVNGYEFTNWKDGNSVLSTNATQEFTVTTDKTYTANYTAIPTYSVTFRTSAEDQNPAVKSDYHSGDLITNRPAIDPQRIGDETHTYSFIGWLLEGTGNTYSNAQVDAMTVSGNMVFTASFDEQIIEAGPVTYNITIGNFAANANGQVVITSQGNTQTVSSTGGVFTFGAGKSVTIQAVPNAYYHFNGWVEDNEEEAVIDIRTLGSDLTYTPTFANNTTITLEDNHNQAYYTSLYSGHDGEVLTVIMQGRQLTEGSWMTFCAPFDFDIPAGHPFRGAVYELQDATMSGTNTAAYISLDFRRTYEMKANVPYLIVPTMTTLSDLEFDHVTIDEAPAQQTVTAESNQVQFISLPWQTTLINDAQKPDFYLATGNNLRYVKTEGGTTFRAFRSYFHRIVNLGAPRRVVISLDGVETTKELTEDGEVVDVTEKRIENGILYIERNGVRYDAQGQRAE